MIRTGVRVSLENLGCRVNRVELDQMALALEEAGATICGAGEADIVVLNTCAVTAEAEAKTRKAIRRSLRLKRKPYVIACGCAAMLAQDEIEGLSDRVEVVPLKAQVPARIMEIARDLDLSPQEPATSSAASTVTPTGRTRPGLQHPARPPDPGRLRPQVHLLHRLEGTRTLAVDAGKGSARRGREG